MISRTVSLLSLLSIVIAGLPPIGNAAGGVVDAGGPASTRSWGAPGRTEPSVRRNDDYSRGRARDFVPAPTPLILVSIDGFRWDYLDIFETRHLSRIASEGVRSQGLIPVFPSTTFPNHYSIVTGLYPEHHGIVANRVLDRERDVVFSPGNRSEVTNPAWWLGEPIWVTAQKQGLTAATFFWVGSEAPIGGVMPTFWFPYAHSIPGDDRVEQVLRWLDLPEAERPAFISVYFADVDDAGHSYGPESDETRDAVQAVDSYIGRLLDGLAERGMTDAVNMIVVSDHGMVAAPPDRVVYLDALLSEGDARVIDLNPVMALEPARLTAEELVEKLRGAHPALTVYARSELPDRYHLRASGRTAAVVVVAEEGWSIRRARPGQPTTGVRGSHGYDNALRSMHGLLLMRGPAFAAGRRLAPVENVHIYELMCHLLGVTPSPNDGRPDAFSRALRTD